MAVTSTPYDFKSVPMLLDITPVNNMLKIENFLK